MLWTKYEFLSSKKTRISHGVYPKLSGEFYKLKEYLS